MKIATPDQMGTIDSITIKDMGIPGILLMENAAIKVVDEISATLGSVFNKNICVFAGKGNNGGDALAVARHLFNKGANVCACLVAAKQEVKGDAAINLNILEKMGIDIIEINGKAQLDRINLELLKSQIVVDGLYGTGLKGEINGLTGEIIKMINTSEKYTISIDIPSGVCGITGHILGTCIKADKTVTLCLPKPGLLIHPGCEYTGELVVADISVPSRIIDGMELKMNIIDSDFASANLPKRHPESNKGDYGKVLIISGSIGMTGAGYLAAGAACRSGAGLVCLGVPSKLTPIYDSLMVEAVTIPLADNGMGVLSRSCLEQILEMSSRMDVIAIGPGLSLNRDITEITIGVISQLKVPVILDADSLNAIAGNLNVFKRQKAPIIVTPHPGEMSRLAGISIEDVQNNRIDVAREFACTWGVTTVLKGARSIVALPDGTIFINPTGNSGLATGGTGDVLTGIIASLIGQGAKPEIAAVVGVYLHGLSGDNVAKIKGEHGLIAGDLLDEIPQVIKKLNILNI